MRLKEQFKDINKEDSKLVRSSYDVVGDIAILEIDLKLKKYEKKIANEVLKLKNVNTVVKKEGGHEGVYRLQKYKFLAGEDKRETIHKENGIIVKLNIEKTYFSPRLSNERMRIAKQVKDCEEVLVMFSGCGIYQLVIAKNSRVKEIYGVDINKDACKYAEENVALNKIKKIKLFCMDVNKFKVNKKFDRIIMPLPKNAESFLKCAKRFSKKGTIIHLYTTSDSDFKENIKKVFKTFKIISVVECGQIAPRIYRLCVDFKV